MLFNPITPQVQPGTIQPVDRKTKAAKLIDFYQGQELEDLKADLLQYTGNNDQLKPACINLVKKIIKRLAQVYRRPAARTIDGTEADKALFADIEARSNLNVKMKQAQRFTKLCKIAFLKVSWRSGRVALDVVTPDVMDLETGNAPDDIKAAIITYHSPTGREKDTVFHRWTDETFQLLDYRGREISRESNPYHLIPVIPLWDEPPLDDPFLPVPDDLISIQEAVNMKLTDLLHTVAMQAHGQPVSKGLPQRSSLKVGVNSVVSLPADTSDLKHDFKFADTNAKINETVAAIEKIIHWLFMTYGIPASSISAQNKEASGTAKQVDNWELSETRQDDIDLFRNYEKQLFTTIQAVNDHHNPVKFSQGATFTVDFAEIKPPVSETDQLTTWEKELDMGLVSRVDLAMRKNPDLTREDAEALLFRIQQDNETHGEAHNI